jgi:hypothetical protein
MADVLLVCTGVMIVGALLVALFLPGKAAGAGSQDEAPASSPGVAV